MNDEQYEVSADMRLLDLQREALGVPRRALETAAYTEPDYGVDNAKPDDDPFIQSGSILIAAVDAQPRTALIPGALVTVSFSVANDGDARANGVRMSLPLPAATAYRPGSLAIDGIAGSDEVAAELFGNGAEIGDVEPGSRRSVMIKLVVEAGLGDITLAPHLSASSAAILGLRAMRLARKSGSARDALAELPFYASDEAEHAIEPLAPPTPVPTIAVLQPSEFPPTPPAPPAAAQAVPPAVEPPAAVAKPATRRPAEAKPEAKNVPPAATKPSPPAAPKIAAKRGPELKTVAAPSVTSRPSAAPDQRSRPAASAAGPTIAAPAPLRAITKRGETKAEPKTRAKAVPKPKTKSKGKIELAPAPELVVPARPTIEVVRSIDDRISFAGQGGPILAVRIDRRRLMTLTGLFSGASLGMVAHYLVLNALATREPLPGDGSDASIAAFVADQEQLLSRALIATRLGKTPAADSIGATLPPFPPAFTPHTERRIIETPPKGEIALFRAFRPSEVAFVQRMLSNNAAAPFMRAAQLFVGLCANDAVVANDRERHHVAVALTGYAALATGEISRIFLRARLGRAPDLFKPTEAAFDDAARTVLAALARTIA
jgi:uncharacterized repeat protein (TIGR01451 family)